MKLGVVHKPRGSGNWVGLGLAPPYCPIALLLLDCFACGRQIHCPVGWPTDQQPVPNLPPQPHPLLTSNSTPCTPPPHASQAWSWVKETPQPGELNICIAKQHAV
jgi:hypothetical protein